MINQELVYPTLFYYETMCLIFRNSKSLIIAHNGIVIILFIQRFYYSSIRNRYAAIRNQKSLCHFQKQFQ